MKTRELDKENKCNKVIEEWNEKHPDKVCFFEHPQLIEMLLKAAGYTFEDGEDDTEACAIVDSVITQWKTRLKEI